jgi:hypothetical protein
MNPKQAMTIPDSGFSGFCGRLNLTAIRQRLTIEKNWTAPHALFVETRYKAFLFLLGFKGGTPLVPCDDVGAMWRAHIIETEKYISDCDKLFGRYVHHHPFLVKAGKQGDASDVGNFAPVISSSEFRL